MAYVAGVDLGTTYTAAAIWRDGHPAPEVVVLATHAASMPSVVFVDTDGTVLVGEPAEARSGEAPERVAREFKRRLGDAAPIIVGGAPWSPDALMGEVLRAVMAQVTALEGGPPDLLVLSHPANWGPYRIEQFQGVPRLAGITVPTALVPEPVAAAEHYVATGRVAPGAVVVVYDLGGGTFDATVLRVGAGGAAEVLAEPDGVDRFGGIDVDSAVFEHVRRSVPHLFVGLDGNDPVAAAALTQVRASCRAAKEALSADTQAAVVVALPTGVAQVRMTRSELEDLLRPQLGQTIAATQRSLAAAELAATDIDRVLLVGGASRMPAVAELVSGAFGRTVAVDADPKHAVALGAARRGRDARASALAAPEPIPEPIPEPTPEPIPEPPVAPEPPAVAGRGRRLVLVGAVAVALVVIAVALLTLGGDDEPDGLDETTASGAETTTTIEPPPVVDAAVATDSQLDLPQSVAVAPDGRIVIADYGNNRIRSIDTDGTITTIAGTGDPGGAGDGGPATDAQLDRPQAVAIDPDGRIVVAEGAGNRIRAIDTDGTITTIAGTGEAGGAGDDGPATDAQLDSPEAVLIDDDGRVLVSDFGNNRIRAIDTDGTITTIAGTGEAGDAGDDGPATDAQLDQPVGLAIDDDGRILVADYGNHRIRAIDTDGTITTIAGTGEPGDAGDGGPATDALLRSAQAVLVVDDGRILVADTGNHRIRAIDPDGTIDRFAGTGEPGDAGDGGPGLQALLTSPLALAVDGDGRILVADDASHRVRAVDAADTITTIAGTGSAGD